MDAGRDEEQQCKEGYCMNFRQQRGHSNRQRQRRLNSEIDWLGNKREIKDMEVTGRSIYKLAELIAKRIPGSDLVAVSTAVKNCQINSLTGAIVALNGELEGPMLEPGELNMMCAQLGVEVGSSLSSVLHLVSDTDVQHDGAFLSELQQADVKMVTGCDMPSDHWIYAALESVAPDAIPPAVEEIDIEVRGQFINDLRTAARNAIRKSTDFGKDVDFDPDALIIELVSELCGTGVSVISADGSGHYQTATGAHVDKVKKGGDASDPAEG